VVRVTHVARCSSSRRVGDREVLIDPVLTRIDALLSPSGLHWAIAGGWAIDLFLGRQTRAHADVDVGVWRDQQRLLRTALPGWELSVAEDHRLRPWREAETLQLPLFEIHARNPDGQSIEFLLNDRARGQWLFRREPTIRLPEGSLVKQGGAAIPFFAPEVVLLYKSKAPRPVDDEDFRNTAPHLSADSRAWLIDAMSRAYGSHPWLGSLALPGAPAAQ